MKDTVKSKYDEYSKDRASVITRAESASRLTIPSVFPKGDISDSSALSDCYQSLGARAVLNLSSKLMQTLFPVNVSFFKLIPDKELEEQILSGENPDMLDNLNEGLVKLETGIKHEMTRQRVRTPIHEAMKSLIVTGNALLWKDEGSLTMVSLRDYVVKRDNSGNLLDVIVREQVSPRVLPDDITVTDETVESVDIYSRLVNDGEGNYQFYQEIEEKTISGSEKPYKMDEPLPFIVLRWTALPKNNYGRGLVEHYIGDLRNYEAMNMVITDMASVMARVVFLVNPNTNFGTNVEELNKTVTGDFIAGHADDITVPQVGKNADLNSLYTYMQGLEQRLSQAFLLFSTRDAERVTAQEIRQVSQQLEETLGGVYTLIGDELQRPLLGMFMQELNIDVGEQIKPIITTGLEALGRGADINKLMVFLEALNMIPEGWAEINVNTVIKRLAYGTGVDIDNLVKTAEQKQQEMEAQQQNALMEAGGSALAQQGGQNVANIIAPQETQGV